MAGKDKSRQRMITIMRYLRENVENGGIINIQALQGYLGEMSSNRQIIYKDLNSLAELGAGVTHTLNRHYIYQGQSFSDGELMLLADVICSSSFLSAQKAKDLLLHIRQMTNMKRFDDLEKDIDVVLRNKTLNESCIKNIEIIHDAIRDEKKISFSYAKYDDDGELYYCKKTKDGYEKVLVATGEQTPLGKEQKSIYYVSPYKMVWDNSQCYVICGGILKNNSIKIYNLRADKIFELSVLDNKIDRLISSHPFYDHKNNTFDTEKYLSSVFEMYGSNNSELTRVEFVVSKNLKGAMIDKFGSSIRFEEYDDRHYRFTANVQVSDVFFGWLAKYSFDKVRIISPPGLIDRYREHLLGIIGGYDETQCV